MTLKSPPAFISWLPPSSSSSLFFILCFLKNLSVFLLGEILLSHGRESVSVFWFMHLWLTSQLFIIFLKVTSKSCTSFLWAPPILPLLHLLPYLSQSMHAQSLSCVRLFVMPWIVAHQAPLFMEFSRQEYWSELPFPCSHIQRDNRICLPGAVGGGRDWQVLI